LLLEFSNIQIGASGPLFFKKKICIISARFAEDEFVHIVVIEFHI